VPVTRKVVELTTDTTVLQRLVAPAGLDVLDVGCGPGALVRELTATGARAIGLEISDEQLASARRRDPDGQYLVGRAEQLPLEDATVDLVVFMRALHHIPIRHMTGALSEAQRVLRPGGAVYVAEPLAQGSFFELTSLVEDELAVRRAAQDALSRAGEAGLERLSTTDYVVEARLQGVEALRRRLTAVDPDRASVFEARRDEIAAAFDRLGEPGEQPGERVFHQPMRADLLRREGF
jgi:SAM-dependent methyltransferase